MPRIRRIENLDRIFFITTNVSRNVRPFNDEERDLVLRALASVREKHSMAIAGYVVMPDHMHLLLVPSSNGLATDMQMFKRASQLYIRHARGHNIPLWQPRYFDHIIRRVRDFWEKLEYIHNNPVAAGLVARLDGWKWSSFSAYWTKVPPIIPVDKLGLPTRGEALLWPARWKRPCE